MSPIAFQLRLEEDLHEQLRDRAAEEGLPMATLVKRLIRDALKVSAGDIQPAGIAPAGSAIGTERVESLLEQQLAALQQLVELNRQVQVTPPHGGTSAGVVSESASANAPRVSGFEVSDPNNPFGGGVGATPRVSAERDLAAIAPLVAGKWLVAEASWQPFTRSVPVTIKLADGSALKAMAKGQTTTEVSVDYPEGGWPGGEVNAGLSRVVAPIEVVTFEETPAPIDVAEPKEAAE